MNRHAMLTLLTVILLFTVFGTQLTTATPEGHTTQTPSSPPQTIVYMSPPTITATAGQDIKVEIRVENVVNLWSWDTGLWWNSSALECLKFEEGPFLKAGGSTSGPVFGFINNTAGEIYPPYGNTLLAGGTPVSGSGTLAYVTFRTKAAGTFNVHPSEVTLYNSELSAIPISVVDVFTVVLEGELYPVVTAHNLTGFTGYTGRSRVSDYAFDQAAREISFNVTGPSGPAGFCNVTIPKGLLTANAIQPWMVLMDGEEIAYTKVENATHTSLYFTYTLSTHKIQIRGAGAAMYPDVSITSVAAFPTEVMAGETVVVTVVVKNKGAGNQTFQVTSYYDNIPIETQAVSNLTSGASETLKFNWNTTGVAPGIYTIKAVASTVEGEIATDDNTLEDGTVSIIELKPVIYVNGSNVDDPLEDGSLEHPFDKIQEGVNAANPGDVVRVASGTYYEHVTVDKSVKLVGEGAATTIIDGNGTWIVVHVSADNVEIRGLTIRNGMGKEGYFFGIWAYRLGDTIKGITVIDNTVSNNFVGINVVHCVGSFVCRNTVTDNQYGIKIHSSSGSTVGGNTVNTSWLYGVYLFASNNNTIVGNTISYNRMTTETYGVYIEPRSSGNTLYHNNFINNTIQAYDNGTNTWDNSAEGNYWSDYTGKDLDNDGIGDTPYVIEPKGLDRYPLMHPYPAILVEQAHVSDNRCDVGSVQTVSFHAKWTYDGSDVAGGCIYVNQTKYVTNRTGWISFNVAYNTVGKRSWTVTGVSLNGITKHYKQVISNPSIIWDRVQLTLDIADDRINVSDNASITCTQAIYEYDGSSFTGSFSLNDTTVKDNIGKYGYTVQSISDPKYGLTKFTSNSVSVIFDKIIIELSIGDSRIDAGANATITWNGVYDYDDTPFGGSIKLNNTQTLYDTVGRRGYTVDAIDDPLYGITVFTSNSVDCIWDRVDITLSAADSRINVGSTGSYSFVAVYAYDAYTATPYVSLTLNDTLTKGKVGKYGYTVSSISETQYGLTTFESNSVYLIFDKVIITVHIPDNRINVGTAAPITWTGVYEYDDSEFTGTATLNDTLTKNAVGKYWYTVTSISDPTYGITAFKTDVIYCIFDKVTITLSVSATKIKVGSTADITWTAVYQYDNTEYDGTIALNDTLTKSEAGRYGYTVLSISGDTHGITAFESNSVYVIFEEGPGPVPVVGFPWWIVGILAAAILASAAAYLWVKKRHSTR